MNKITYQRLTCTNCGVTEKSLNCYNVSNNNIFTLKCYHCEPIHSKHEKKDNNNVNILRKTI